MKEVVFFLYELILALWVGGITIFTFVVTPRIFRAFSRDVAANIVGKLFPGYFKYNLALSCLALPSFLLAAPERLLAWKLSAFLLPAALIMNLVIVLKVLPEAARAKKDISSFETESPASPARSRFSRLHAISAVLNLLLLADGVSLLIAASFMKR